MMERVLFGVLIFPVLVTSGWEIAKISLNFTTTTVATNENNFTYVGGKDYLAIVNQETNSVTQISFAAAEATVTTCKQFSSGICFNSLKVVQKLDKDTLVVCGTNAGSQQCVKLSLSTFNKVTADYAPNTWLDKSPSFRTASIILKSGSSPALCVGSCLGTSCVIKRFSTTTLTTYSNSINSGTEFLAFHESNADGGKIYSFFREPSTAFALDQFTSAGTSGTYAMVSRVCQRDEGGSYRFVKKWTTFMKIRLLCPSPGGAKTGGENLYFNYLRSVVVIEDTVYGLFSLNSDWNIGKTALCSFKLAEIDSYFNGKAFPGGKTLYYDSTKSDFSKTFTGDQALLPGRCPSASQSTKTIANGLYETFLQDTNMIKGIVKPTSSKPTHIYDGALYSHITGFAWRGNHVLYTLEDNGNLRKQVVQAGGTNVAMLNNAKIFDNKSVTSFSVSPKSLVVVTTDELLTVPFADCTQHVTCSVCVRDPHCKWGLSCAYENEPGNPQSACPPSSMKPRSFKVDTTNGVTVQWTKSDYVESPDYYTVAIVAQASNKTVYTEQLTSQNQKVTNDNLKIGVPYRAEIYAVANNSRGPSLTSTFVIKPNAPSAVSNFPTDTTFSAIFKTVKGATSYNVSLLEGGSLKQNYLIYSPESEPNFRVYFYDLAQSRKYSVSVVAVAESGEKSNVFVFEFTTASPAATTTQATSTSTGVAVTGTTAPTVAPTPAQGPTDAVRASVSTGVSITASLTPSINKTSTKATETEPVTSVPTQTASKSTSEPSMTQSTAKVLPNRGGVDSLEGGGANFLVPFVAFLVLFLLALVLIVLNHFAFGNARHVKSLDDQNVTFERTVGIMWKRRYAASEEAAAYSNGASPTPIREKTESISLTKQRT